MIKLVKTTPDDYNDYFRIRCSPADIYWNGYTAPPDYNSFQNIFLSRIYSAPFNKPEDRKIYLVQNNDGLNIGFTQLIWREDCIEIGYTIIEAFQRRGYATEALQEAVKIARRYKRPIIVRIRDDNAASQRVAAKNGFIRTNLYSEKEYPHCGFVKLRTYRLPTLPE